MKKGDLVKYNADWSGIDFIGIVLECLEGYHYRKSWSDRRTFVPQGIIKIYWLCEPSCPPLSATREIMDNWERFPPQSTSLFENTNNCIVEEWEKLAENSWYFCDKFEIVSEDKK